GVSERTNCITYVTERTVRQCWPCTKAVSMLTGSFVSKEKRRSASPKSHEQASEVSPPHTAPISCGSREAMTITTGRAPSYCRFLAADPMRIFRVGMCQMSEHLDWMKLYRAALRETNPEKQPARLEEAKNADEAGTTDGRRVRRFRSAARDQ